MAFNNYLEDENDKPYFTTNSLAYYYDKMEGFAKAVEGSAKALNLTKEEIEQRIALRLQEWDKNLESFDGSVEKLLTEWVDDGTLAHVIDVTLIDQKVAPVAAQLADMAVNVSTFSHLVLNGDWKNALQAAIDSIPHGKIILNQDIAISDTVKLKDGITLDCMGYKVTSIQGFPSNNMILLANGKNITIQNFHLLGHEGNKVRGIQSVISENIKIVNGTFENLGFYGLLFANAVNPYADSLLFKKVANNSLSVGDPVITGVFRNDYTTKGKFSNLKFQDVNGKALSFSYSKDCFIDVLDVRNVGKSNDGANGSGLYINYESENITVNNLYTEKTGVAAVKISRGAKNITIKNALIVCKDIDKSGVDFYAVILQGSDKTKFIDCRFELDMARYGVQIVNHSETMDVSKNNQFINCEFVNTNPFASSVVINQESGFGTVLDNCTISTVGYGINCGEDTVIKNGTKITSTATAARAITCKDRTIIKDSIVFGGERGINLSGAKDVIITRCDVQAVEYGIAFASGVERADISYTKVKSGNHALFGGNPINSEIKFNDLLSNTGLSISVSGTAINNKFLFNNIPKSHNIVVASNVMSNNFIV